MEEIIMVQPWMIKETAKLSGVTLVGTCFHALLINRLFSVCFHLLNAILTPVVEEAALVLGFSSGLRIVALRQPCIKYTLALIIETIKS